MAQTSTVNRKRVLAERPKGQPTSEMMRSVTDDIPVPLPGQMLLRTEYLALDPCMRGRMSDGPSYAPPVAIGDVMVGGTVAQVAASHVAGFAAGDWVLGHNGWQDCALSDGQGVTPLGRAPAHPSSALGILGMPGFSAWAGLKEIGKPMFGETIVVAAATGPVGATAGQIGRITGCTVIGIAAGPAKRAYAVDELGFDTCTDHKAGDLAAQLKAAAPKSIDIYFESVGGAVLDAVLPQPNLRACVPVCGIVLQHNATVLPDGPDRLNWLMGVIVRKQITIRGFIIFDDFVPLFRAFAKEMAALVETGRIKYREDIIDGLENASQAFIGLLNGDNFGKRVIRVGPPTT